MERKRDQHGVARLTCTQVSRVRSYGRVGDVSPLKWISVIQGINLYCCAWRILKFTIRDKRERVLVIGNGNSLNGQSGK